MNAPEFTEMDESIYEVLAAIHKRPGFYVSAPSINELSAFLTGYTSGLGRFRYVLKDTVEFHEFHDWVARRLGFGESTSGWRNMIREKSGDEKEAFEKCFVLLDEFRKEVGTDAGRSGSTNSPTA